MYLIHDNECHGAPVVGSELKRGDIGRKRGNVQTARKGEVRHTTWHVKLPNVFFFPTRFESHCVLFTSNVTDVNHDLDYNSVLMHRPRCVRADMGVPALVCAFATLLFLAQLSICEASHFRGGILMWKPGTSNSPYQVKNKSFCNASTRISHLTCTFALKPSHCKANAWQMSRCIGKDLRSKDLYSSV